MASRKRATFMVDEEVWTAMQQAVADGAATSMSAFVERALLRELGDVRRRERQRRWEEAARDPLFLRDMADLAGS